MRIAQRSTRLDLWVKLVRWWAGLTWAWATDLICENNRMFTAQSTTLRITSKTHQVLWYRRKSEWSNIRNMINCQHHRKATLTNHTLAIFNSPTLSTRTFIAAKSERNRLVTNKRALWTRQVEFTGLMAAQSEQTNRRDLFKEEMLENVAKTESQTSNHRPITSSHLATSVNSYLRKDQMEVCTHLRTNTAIKLILRT